MSILMVLGNQGPIFQSKQIGWSYLQGEQVQDTYKGVYAAVKTLYDTYKAFAQGSPTVDSLQLSYERGMGTLTIATVEDGPVQYELVSNQESRSIFTHPYFVDEATVLTASEIHAVRTAFELGINVNPSQGLAYPFDGSAFNAKATQLYGFISRGVETYNQCAYVLRQSQVCSKRSTLQASYVNANKVEAPPNVSTVNSLIGILPAGEWLKQSPNVQTYGAKKWQISQEYWWAPRWSQILYNGTGTP